MTTVQRVKCKVCGHMVDQATCEVRSWGGETVFVCPKHPAKAKRLKRNPARGIRIRPGDAL